VSRERPEGSALNMIHGAISALVHLGGTVRVTVRNGGSIVAEVSARSAAEMGLSVGGIVFAHFKAAAARCYE
jgi:molybdopterin-binding protein